MAAAGLALAGGCTRGVEWLDARDEQLPLVQRALDRAAKGDVDGAVRLYRRALDQEPAAARAHLDLAFLLQDHRKDYVGAIYHYRRYLELRPTAEKTALVEERMRLAEQLFAADVLGPTRMASKVATLEQENEALRRQVDELSSRLLAGRTSAAAASDTRAASDAAASDRTRTTRGTAKPTATAATTAGARPVAKTYRVKRGDTLSSIAVTVYGDGNRWKDIQLANTDILGNSSQVQIGQVLVIP